MTTKKDETKRHGETSGTWIWALIIIVFLLAIISYFYKERLTDFLLQYEMSSPQGPDQNAMTEKIEREAAAILRETDRKNSEAYETAMAELGAVNGAFDLAERGIEPAVNELASFKGCAILCYHMAKDMVWETYETEERISSVLDAHIGRDLLYAGQLRENTLARLNDALARNTTDMQVRLAAMAETVIGSEDETARTALRDYVSRMGEVSEGFSAIALKSVVSGTGLAISALFVKATLRQVTNILGHISRRMGTTTALAIGSAAADGPFPIGDAIGLVLEVGCAAWCAYDLYHAQFTLKNQLTGELRNALTQYRNTTLDLGKKQALALLKAYHEHNSKVAENLTRQLS